ncbi:MAG: DHH family phosphoesterase, partial [Gemmataceae bacterium]
MARRSATSTANSLEPPNRRSDRFLEGLRDASSVLFVSHVHPDPDSLGSMMGLAHLVQTVLKKPTQLSRDGEISRAENRAMVELLDIPLTSLDQLDLCAPGNQIVMVDSTPPRS